MIILKQKECNGGLKTRVKIKVKGKKRLMIYAAGAIASICEAARKNAPEVTNEELMDLARMLMEGEMLQESNR